MRALYFTTTLLFCMLISQSVFCQTTEYKNKIITIGGYLGSKVPLSQIKNATELSVLAPYEFIGATVYFSGCSITPDASTVSLKSTKFNTDFLKLWVRLGVGSVVSFTNIQVKKANGEIGYLIDISFVVTAD